MKRSRIAAAGIIAAVLTGFSDVAAQGARLQVPVEYYKLPNGLKVVLSRDATTPTACVAVYYNIGFRNEPKNRTGFAHLFEHMMFQGSGNLGKMEFIRLVESNGGLLNGSTRFDFTNYFQVVPSHVLEPVLWAEADRMRALTINAENLKNQQEVVKNEVKVNVLNQPVQHLPVDRPADGRERELVQRAQLLRRPEGSRRGDARGRQRLLQDLLLPQQRRRRGDRRLRRRPDQGVDSEILRQHPDSEAAAAAGPARAASAERKARRADRRARHAAGARHRLSPARPLHARVVRVRPDRSGDRAGSRLAALRRSRPEEGADRRRRRRHQLGPRQHVRLQRTDVVDGAVLPRRHRHRRTSCSPQSTASSKQSESRDSIRRRSTAPA